MYFRYFRIISSLGRAWPFIWTNLNPLYPRMLCAKFGWNWPSGSGAEDFYKLWIYFYYFPIIPPLGRAWPFIWTNLNQLHLRMLCAKVGWNWLSGSGEEDFLISSMYFRYFVIISPWKRAGPFIWTNLNALHTRMLCATFGWNWPNGSEEEDFYKLSIYFYYFPIISSLGRACPSFEQTWIPFTQGYFLPSLVAICPVVLEKKMKMWKS